MRSKAEQVFGNISPELDRTGQQEIIVLSEKCLLPDLASKLPSVLKCANNEAVWDSSSWFSKKPNAETLFPGL